jgi:hypothetical protein
MSLILDHVPVTLEFGKDVFLSTSDMLVARGVLQADAPAPIEGPK